MKDVIIHHPEWVLPKQKLLIGVFTLIAWVIWIYLWIPLISLLAWIFGIQLFRFEMFQNDGLNDLMSLLGWYVLTVTVLGGSLILWATYNIQRFSNVARRIARPTVTIAMQAQYFRVSASELVDWQKSRRIVIHNSQIRVLDR